VVVLWGKGRFTCRYGLTMTSAYRCTFRPNIPLFSDLQDMEDDEELTMTEIWEDIPYSNFYQEYLLNNKPCILRSILCGISWKQCWGSETFLCESESPAPDPTLDPTPCLGQRKIFFFPYFSSCRLPAGTLSSV
jgi:hypothetical protein